ncbi:guanylate kinase [Helicobacter sp. 23-1045]
MIIISGPSGAGKSSLCKEAFRQMPNLYFSISSTTRQRRDGEICGVHYNFISVEAFECGIEKGEFVEWARVHNNYYGTPKSEVAKARVEGKIIVFDIDVVGQRAIKAHYPNATSIFITTPSLAELEARLKSRALDSAEVISGRVKTASDEIKSIENFDFVIINDDFKSAVDGFLSIIKATQFKNSDELSKSLCEKWSI